MPSRKDCACGSGVAYAACCAPLHRGEREAESAGALMRSRFAAFARKEVEYVWRTLHPQHEDRARPKADVVRELRLACASNRYLGLRVLDEGEPDGQGIARVLFFARVFRAGRDGSFAEVSEFARDPRDSGAWRYLRGDARPVAAGEDVERWTIASFGTAEGGA